MPNEFRAWVDRKQDVPFGWPLRRWYCTPYGGVKWESDLAYERRTGLNPRPGGFTVVKGDVSRYMKPRWDLPRYTFKASDVSSAHWADAIKIWNIKPEEKMLDLTRKYRTRNGQQVGGLAYSGDRTYIKGVIFSSESHRQYSWWPNGRVSESGLSPVDLVPACDPIVLSRKYKTAKGEAVELFKIADGCAWGRYNHGMYDGHRFYGASDIEWRSHSWDVNDHTLVPVVRKEKRVYWLGHYRDGTGSAYSTRELAEAWTKKCGGVATTGPHEIEIEIDD